MQKICIFTETFFPVSGGGETQAYVLARCLSNAGAHVLILTRRIEKSHAKYEKKDNISIIRIPPTGKHHYKKWGLLITSIPYFFKFSSEIDKIYVSGFKIIGFISVILSKILGKDCILKADSMGEMSGQYFSAGLSRIHLNLNSQIVKWMVNFRNKILKKADLYIAISSVIENEYLAYGIDRDKIHKIPNFVEVTRFHPVDETLKKRLRSEMNLPLFNDIIIYTGRLVSYKGLEILLKVFKEISKKYLEVTLLLVGEGGLDIHNCEARLKKYCLEANLQKNIRFTGKVENVEQYLQVSDIFVFPTQKEAFGLSLIEAMSCGLPAISTKVGGLSDILVHNKNSMVIEPENFENLYEAIEFMLTNVQKRIIIGVNARRTVENRFSANKVCNKYKNLIFNIN